MEDAERPLTTKDIKPIVWGLERILKELRESRNGKGFVESRMVAGETMHDAFKEWAEIRPLRPSDIEKILEKLRAPDKQESKKIETLLGFIFAVLVVIAWMLQSK